MLSTFPKFNFSLKFPEILIQNHMLSLTECVREFQNNALWDTIDGRIPVNIRNVSWNAHVCVFIIDVEETSMSMVFIISDGTVYNSANATFMITHATW